MVSAIPSSQDWITNVEIIVILAILLFIVLFTRIWTLIKKYDHVWFAARAIAESVKAETWRFMMKVEPYEEDLKADGNFLKRLQEILHYNRSCISELTTNSIERSEISETMKQIRKKSIQERKDCYTKNRIIKQKNWYTKKANWNSQRETIWQFISWILQIGAITIAIVIIAFTDSNFIPIGIITTAGAGTLTWMNSKRFRELGQSYSIISHDLAIILTKAKEITRDEELSELVLETERTISREHAMWLAKRIEPHSL